MKPFIKEGDYVIYKRFQVKKHLIKIGTLVILKNPLDTNHLLVKRVVNKTTYYLFSIHYYLNDIENEAAF